MAEWLGNLIASVPDWLFMPLLILVIIVAILWYWLDATAYSGGWWPFKSDRRHLGEKKYDEK